MEIIKTFTDKNIFIYIAMFSCLSLNAQKQTTNHYFNTNLLSLLNTNYSSYTIGYEYKPHKNFGLEITYGHIRDSGEFQVYRVSENDEFHDKVNKFDAKGSIIRIEPKLYIKHDPGYEDMGGIFLSIKYYYTNLIIPLKLGQ